ncbi:MAG: hypothetical protein Tsb0020_28400 [Haliangiales bacterium]
MNRYRSSQPAASRRGHARGRALGLLVGAALISIAAVSMADDPPKTDTAPPAAAPTPATPEQQQAARAAFADVYKVLQSPRCMNCHPDGDRPLQTDNSRPHKMNISRLSAESGLPCSSCHQEHNSERVGVASGPPGAPHWGLPPAETPMIFQGRSPRALCEQLNDPVHTGGRSLADLLHHVGHDALVLWGWKPGGERTVPPISHEQFVASFSTWVTGGGACPE